MLNKTILFYMFIKAGALQVKTTKKSTILMARKQSPLVVLYSISNLMSCLSNLKPNWFNLWFNENTLINPISTFFHYNKSSKTSWIATAALMFSIYARTFKCVVKICVFWEDIQKQHTLSHFPSVNYGLFLFLLTVMFVFGCTQAQHVRAYTQPLFLVWAPLTRCALE